MNATDRQAIYGWLQAADADTLNKKEFNPWPWRYARDVRLLLAEIERLEGEKDPPTGGKP